MGGTSTFLLRYCAFAVSPFLFFPGRWLPSSSCSFAAPGSVDLLIEGRIGRLIGPPLKTTIFFVFIKEIIDFGCSKASIFESCFREVHLRLPEATPGSPGLTLGSVLGAQEASILSTNLNVVIADGLRDCNLTNSTSTAQN